jgi:hypothetical protein
MSTQEEQEEQQLEWFRKSVKSAVDKIENNFTVTDSHIEDYDEYGAKEEYVCANGWIGWSWNWSSAIQSEKDNLCKYIVNNGIENDNGKKIFYDISIVRNMIFN